MTDRYIQREVLTLPTVEVWHREGKIIITHHLNGTQVAIDVEQFLAAAVDAWCVKQLEDKQ